MAEEPDYARRQEDRAAIADLVHLYAQGVHRAQPEACAALFTADGAFEVREVDPAQMEAVTVRSRAEGREAVAGYIANATGQARMLPMIHNLIVDLGEGGDEASASSLMVGRVWPTDREIVGEYADSFRRENGVWRFSQRLYTIWRAGQG